MHTHHSSAPVVTRFAPSPTGFMHIGNVRTALFAYLWARKNNGVFILRVEDTDRERLVHGAMEHMMQCLAWLGIEWDYGPDKANPFGSAIQSERLHTYRPFAERLVEKGLAYPDPYTLEEVEAFRAQAQVEKRPFLFRKHRPKTFEKWDGTKSLRFKVPEIKRYKWHDEVRGELEAGEEALDDFILMKSDGYPTYNFAHIIDDHLMGVTHIMRGEEFISSTPRFLSLYDALEIPYPAFVTLPPILRQDRTKKLGKRDGAKDFLSYRDDGYLPEAMANFLALIGWNPGTDRELFTMPELIAAFDIHQIQKSGGVLNEDKLDWFNKLYLAKMNDDAFEEYLRSALSPELLAFPDRAKMLMPIIRERAAVRSDVKEECENGEYDWAFKAPTVDAAKIVWKEESVADALHHIAFVHACFKKVDDTVWRMDVIKDAVWSYAEVKGKGSVLWPVRYALTGKDKSPDPFAVATIIGKEETLKRLDAAVQLLRAAL